MKKTKNFKKKRKNKTFKGGSNQSEKQTPILNQNLVQQNNLLKQKIAIANDALQNLKQKMRLRDNEEIKNLNAQNQQKSSQINQLTGENQRAESKIKELSSENQDLLSKTKELVSKINEFGSENQELISKIDDLEARIQHANKVEESTDRHINMLSNENEQLKLSLNQRDKITEENERLKLLINERDKKIYHLWRVLCKYIIYTGGLQNKIREDINNYQARINEIDQFTEWFNQNVSGRLPTCDENISLETWLSGNKTDNIYY
jgi:chromosome segregation ATPase